VQGLFILALYFINTANDYSSVPAGIAFFVAAAPTSVVTGWYFNRLQYQALSGYCMALLMLLNVLEDLNTHVLPERAAASRVKPLVAMIRFHTLGSFVRASSIVGQRSHNCALLPFKCSNVARMAGWTGLKWRRKSTSASISLSLRWNWWRWVDICQLAPCLSDRTLTLASLLMPQVMDGGDFARDLYLKLARVSVYLTVSDSLCKFRLADCRIRLSDPPLRTKWPG
jgi:hypothetical protein